MPDEPTTRFSRLTLHSWRQFRQVDVEFHPRLTVLTGVNGSGKTTLLSILSRHFRWSSQFMRVRLLRKDGPRYQVGLAEEDNVLPGQTVTIGSLEYTTGEQTALAVPIQESPQYDIQFLNGQPTVPGLYLPSHRAIFGYQQVQNVPPQFSESDQLLEQFLNELIARHTGGYSGRSAALQMKEALLAAAIYGEGNSSVEANPEALAVWRGFQETLTRLLPKELGFRRLYVSAPDVIVDTDTGAFPIDAVSGGVSAIVELAWQVFLRSRRVPAFTVCMDEPENHLHPSLQRYLLSGLLDAFPRISFIIATHSPFIVTSVPESNVYVFDIDDEKKVVSTKLDFLNKASSAEDVLRNVLGLDSTLPVWAEHQLNGIVDRFLTDFQQPGAMTNLRADLAAAGLEKYFPDVASEAVERAWREETNEGT